ncbi:MAG: homoserine dehydrogenase [Candidatus Omnitrophica bacterium]|nr:homoserine dehydrogenase [Candidatus Omnitrophota bacterium]
MKPIQVGLIGLGTVGTGVAKVLIERQAWFSKRAGVPIVLKKIATRHPARQRPVRLKPGLVTRNPNDILQDPEIQVVIELVGGLHPAKEWMAAALRAKKHVITANKALLAHHGPEIFKAAARAGVSVHFEASVAGGIPIIKGLREGLVANEIQALYGIINGTSNFILSEMSREGCSFDAALKEAQQRGYAERNPALDLKGIDTAHKLSILSLLAFGKTVQPEEMFVEGIPEITHNDIHYAKDLGYSVKLLAIAKREGNELELRVHPTLLPRQHPLSRVHGVYNAIYVKGDLVGEQLFYGQGAGRWPTASAVLADVVDVARAISAGTSLRSPALDTASAIRRIRPMGEIEGRYYFRFSCIDRPGVLAKIARILGTHHISIASVIQPDRRRDHIVPLIMVTHEARERQVQAALAEIDRLSIIRRKTVAIRIERG